MTNGSRQMAGKFVLTVEVRRKRGEMLCKPRFLKSPLLRTKTSPKGNVMLTDDLENENFESEENQENSEELDENQENSEELEQNQESSIDYELFLQELQYIKELQEYEQTIQERQAIALENIQNLCNQLSNTVYISAGAILSMFLFFVLALVIKFFRSLLDF